MNVLKQILVYLIWVSISFLSAFGYVLLIVGSKPNSSNSTIDAIGLIIYYVAIYRLVPIIGAIIAVLYILTDVFYLKSKLKNNPKRIIIRFLVIIFITLAVGIIHYILEKAIDVI